MRKLVPPLVAAAAAILMVAAADGTNERLVAQGCVGNCNDLYWPDPSWQPLR